MLKGPKPKSLEPLTLCVQQKMWDMGSFKRGQIRDCELAKKVGTLFGFSYVDGFFMKNKIILVVEDNDLNMKLVKSLLEMGNYDVLEAMEAQTGIRLAREHRPDLILMDIQLPGMDGLTATRVIKGDDALKDIPVVAITSYAMEGDERRTREAGCAGYMAKPIDTRSFLENITQYLK